MIQLCDKHNCCGCSACVQACPKQCISFRQDDEGFFYPSVNKEICVDCGLCDKVCPYLNQNDSSKPIDVYASMNPDENVRQKSSSGGIFSMLAERTIRNGGVVFGAKFNENWEVVHDYTETVDGIKDFQGSKYVQSIIGDSFKKAKTFLTEGREVLFSGTPCQIAGFKHFLRKKYDNLVTIECVCHGVPSPLIWNDYLHNDIAKQKQNKISNVNFRDKRNGWIHYGFSALRGQKDVFTTKDRNHYMTAFLHNYSIRPSCYSCPAKDGKSNADITLGDFWGVDVKRPDCYDRSGVSLVLIRSDKGQMAFESIKPIYSEISYNDAIWDNPGIEKSAKEPIDRTLFWKHISERGFQGTYNMLVKLEPKLWKTLLCKTKNTIKKIISR